MWLITASRGVGPKCSEAAENYPITQQPIKAFFFFFKKKKKKNPSLDSHHMELFWERVLWASWNYSGTPVPTTGLTLMSVVNGCSAEVCSQIPPPSFLPITVKQAAFTSHFCKTLQSLHLVLGKLPLAKETQDCLSQPFPGEAVQDKAGKECAAISENNSKHSWAPVGYHALYWALQVYPLIQS